MPWTLPADFVLATPPTAHRLAGQLGTLDDVALLGLNESPLGPSPHVATAVAEALADINRYPDIRHAQLCHAVAARTGVEEGRQVWGAGANDLLHRAVLTAVRAGLNVVAPTPTFWGYERIYRLTGVDARRVELVPDGRTDVEGLLAAVDDRTGLVSVITPGNPSGLAVTRDELVHLAEHVPERVLLLVDEVYFEFAGGSLDAVEVLSAHRRGHWAVLRSFSKAYALAAARIGYALCSSADVAHRLIESGLNFPVSMLSFAAAFAAYEDQAYLEHLVRTTIERRERLRAGLAILGLDALPSDTNFVSVALPFPALHALEALRAEQIFCAHWNHSGFDRFLRITVGTDAEIDRAVAVLGNLLRSRA